MYNPNKIKQACVATLVILFAKFAFGAEKLLLNGNCTGTEISGRDAVVALVKNPKEKIIKYSEVELSDKTGKIKNKSNR